MLYEVAFYENNNYKIPTKSLKSVLAPLFKKYSTQSNLWLVVAQCRGVNPVSSVALILALLLTKSSHFETSPIFAAK